MKKSGNTEEQRVGVRKEPEAAMETADLRSGAGAAGCAHPAPTRAGRWNSCEPIGEAVAPGSSQQEVASERA
jgi:hypothetical protein